jgi:SP family general alpha glucoside:H+ symporter-like MFS transporter
MRNPSEANVCADHQIIAERYGYRKVMMCALVYMSCIFFLHFFAQSLPMLLVAQILVGVPWGSESIHK